MAELLAFNRWSTKDIKVEDLGLQRYIEVAPRIAPKTGARYAGNQFHKSRIFIVERLINKFMIPGHRAKKHKITSGFCTGKSATATDKVLKALEIVEEKTGQNPIAVLVKAIENAATREEIVSIEYGGARYPKAVECSPQRRIDLCLRLMVQGAFQKSSSSKKTAESALADEILNAFKNSNNSAAIAKKLELERQADSAR